MGDLSDLAQALQAAERQAMIDLAAADDADGMKDVLAWAGGELADQVGHWYGQPRTPLMVAAACGSAGVVSLLLGLGGFVDVARRSGSDGFTALHCAASGGSCNAFLVAKMLIDAGADPTTAEGRSPADVIPASGDALGYLASLLRAPRALAARTPASSGASSSSPALSSSSSNTVDRGKKKVYQVDPTLPDMKSGAYASDEFRMYIFKVWHCRRCYSHDWTGCPFLHPGECARRRDPSRHLYCAEPCPSPSWLPCPRGDNCVYSHGAFEILLHPTRYRTTLCNKGAACDRSVCFFAHGEDELRRVSRDTVADLLSRHAALSSMDNMAAAAALGFLSRHFEPPPGSLSAGNNSAAHWLQGTRLPSFNAKDDDLGFLLDWGSQQYPCVPPSSRPQPRHFTGLSIRPAAIAPSTLQDMYASDMAMSSPWFTDQGHSANSPAYKSPILNKLHQQKVNTNRMYSSQGYLEPPAPLQSPVGGMSPQVMEPQSARFGATQHDMYEQFASLDIHQLPTVSSPWNSNAAWGNLGSIIGKVDWSVPW